MTRLRLRTIWGQSGLPCASNFRNPLATLDTRTRMSIGYTLQLSSGVIEDWVMDSDLFTIKSSYKKPIDLAYGATLDYDWEKKLLLLVSVSVDDIMKLLGSKGFAPNSHQQIEKSSYGGRIYYHIQCTIITSSCNLLIHGVNIKTYSETKFIDTWIDDGRSLDCWQKEVCREGYPAHLCQGRLLPGEEG